MALVDLAVLLVWLLVKPVQVQSTHANLVLTLVFLLYRIMFAYALLVILLMVHNAKFVVHNVKPVKIMLIIVLPVMI